MHIQRGLKFLLVIAMFAMLLLRPISAATLEQRLVDGIGEFFDKGAEGYLFWQYSGNKVEKLGTDEFSFFRSSAEGEAVCKAFTRLRTKYPQKFVGVNMWDVGRNDYATALRNFQWLAGCGANMLRINAGVYLGNNDSVAVKVHLNRVLEALTEANRIKGLSGDSALRVIIAIGDYPNGGGGVPKSAGIEYYQSSHLDQIEFTNLVLTATAASPLVYGFEVANEPHCGGNTAAIPAYVDWSGKFSKLLSASGKRVSLGQMANFDIPNCDSIVSSGELAVSGFIQSNRFSTITDTSAHFYNGTQKAMALAALRKSKDDLQKPFYVGEASISATIEGIIPPGVLEGKADKYFIAAPQVYSPVEPKIINVDEPGLSPVPLVDPITPDVRSNPEASQPISAPQFNLLLILLILLVAIVLICAAIYWARRLAKNQASPTI